MPEKRPSELQARLHARLAGAYASVKALDRGKLAAFYREHRRLSFGVAVAICIVAIALAAWALTKRMERT